MRKIFFSLLGIGLLPVAEAQAHGVVGNRFFHATLNVEDPVVADEFAFPTVRRFKETEHDGSAAWVTETSSEFSKRIAQCWNLLNLELEAL